jgi:phosphoribosylamine---glycine ligase
MNVLVLGSGGREHALAWKIKQSPLCTEVYIGPGNGGTDQVGINVPLDIKSLESIRKSLVDYHIDMLVVGPEEPLVRGLVDVLQADKELKNLLIIGPEKAGAMLEGSKDYAKQFMEKYNIPTARARTFIKSNFLQGVKYLESTEPPYVLKADGLAGGKGVIITEDLEEAKNTLDNLINREQFGKAGSRVLIEQFLTGIEVSFFVLTDGKTYRLLPEAKDYKRIGVKDTGLNTGGMGACSPVIFADRFFKEKVHNRIIKPTIDGLRKDKINYKGFLFFGLINVGGEPYLIEYNVRMGDPETQAVLPRIKTDFMELLIATAKETLIDTEIEHERYSTCTVVLASGGYPEEYETGFVIQNDKPRGVVSFHAGTKKTGEQVVTNGGRVLTLTGLGKNLGEAISKGMKAAEEVQFEGKYFRYDIGMDLKELGQ